MKKSTGLYPRVQVDTSASGAVGQAGGVLLTEVVAHVHRLGATPVLDLRENVSLTRQLVERRGFVPLGGPSGAGERFVHR